MKNNKHFWLPVTTWNINDILIDESISPTSFYINRKFGSINYKPADDNSQVLHLDHAIVLYPKNFKFNPSVGAPVFLLISPDALDPSYLVETEEGLAYYFKTIYLRRGNFQLRFQSEMDKKMFEAGSKMNLELKVLPKYKGEYRYSNKPMPIITVKEFMDERPIRINSTYNQRKDKNQDQVYFDKAINHIKGLLYGYLSVIIGGSSIEVDRFKASLEKLKSKTNGLRTRFAMSNEFNAKDADNVFEEINQLKELYTKLIPEPKVDFSNIEDRINQLNGLQEERIAKIKYQKKELKGQIENKSEIFNKEDEDLQRQNFELGKRKEQLRDSKKKLESEFKRAKKNNDELIIHEIGNEIESIKEKIKAIESERKNIRNKQNLIRNNSNQALVGINTELDETINDQFYAITSKLDTWILYKNWKSKKIENIVIPNIGEWNIDIDILCHLYKAISEGKKLEFPSIVSIPTNVLLGLDESDKSLLNVILNTVLAFNHDHLSDVSEHRLSQILEIVITEYSKRNKANKKTYLQITSLKRFKDYKKGQSETFEIPLNSRVASNFIAFLMKSNNNTELKKFLIERNIDNHFLSFLIWGGFMGFSSIPKTFTDQLFEKGDATISDLIDDFLFHNYINQH